jgi:hypothetical protein
MPKICYTSRRFNTSSQAIIDQANIIIEEYQSQGFDLTLRQLYYQFVARDLLPNKIEEYKRLGSVINDARLAGLVDWKAIVDRTRNLESLSHWDSPQDIIESSARQFRIDKWALQPYYPEVWVEKDALVGVLEQACGPLDVSYFACRGYTSQSEMWVASQRLLEKIDNDQTPVIIHLGDHDPSGIDMTRDIVDRLALFVGDKVEVKRIALNWDQIEQYKPPANPAKLSDSRSEAYIARFGASSWELDALDPAKLSQLIQKAVISFRDEKLWKEAVKVEKHHREALQNVADNWEES